jgi:hypothetical protein
MVESGAAEEVASPLPCSKIYEMHKGLKKTGELQ